MHDRSYAYHFRMESPTFTSAEDICMSLWRDRTDPHDIRINRRTQKQINLVCVVKTRKRRKGELQVAIQFQNVIREIHMMDVSSKSAHNTVFKIFALPLGEREGSLRFAFCGKRMSPGDSRVFPFQLQVLTLKWSWQIVYLVWIRYSAKMQLEIFVGISFVSVVCAPENFLPKRLPLYWNLNDYYAEHRRPTEVSALTREMVRQR